MIKSLSVSRNSKTTFVTVNLTYANGTEEVVDDSKTTFVTVNHYQ